MIIHILIEIVVLAMLFLYFYNRQLKLNQRIRKLEAQMKNLSMISNQFPQFIEKGENLTRNISEELTIKQTALKKLIRDAEASSQKLGFLEEKIKEQKLDQSTIDKIMILVNQGFNAIDIAPKLNIPVGEIELVIKLRKYLSSPIKEKL